MLETVLVANRGEIAVRIIRACKSLNIKTIALFTDDDALSLSVKLADEAYSLGSGTVEETYLNIPKIIDLASEAGADAIHPGYGFLSENSTFSLEINKRGLIFIGPAPKTLQALGDKVEARKLAEKNRIPIILGSKGYISSLSEAEKVVEEIGYPIIIKAAFGGGGRGMEIVKSSESLEVALMGCQAIAESFFGRKEVFIEKYISSPKHIEFQFLADNHGNVIHLGDRECSIQRSHQKIIEEAPSFLSSQRRMKIGSDVCTLVSNLSYRNAGTAEFLWKDGKVYFNEINPRIQVEHPITEMITGIDLVVQQIRIARDEELQIKQKDINFKGHAIEYRINAEDPLQSYLPQTGVVDELIIPGGHNVRFDSFLYPSYNIPGSFDSLVGKLIIWGDNRQEAIERSRMALKELTISGVTTNISLHQAILETDEFINREVSTDFLDKARIKDILNHFEKMKLAATITAYYANKENQNSTVITQKKNQQAINRWGLQSKVEQQRNDL